MPESISTGPPLLLINGIAARLEMWQPFASALHDRRLLLFDLPGVTGRAAPGVPQLMPAVSTWLAHLLDAMEVDRADVLGYSWGGVLGQQFARDVPDRVRGLVLVSTNYGLGPPITTIPTEGLTRLWNPLPSTSGDDPWKLLTAALGGAPNGRNALGAILAALNPESSSFDGYLRQLFALTAWTSLPWLHTLRTPTLIVAGNDDPFIPTSVTRTLADAVPDAQLEFVSGGGHLIPTNQPDLLAGMVRTFLEDLDGRTTSADDHAKSSS